MKHRYHPQSADIFYNWVTPEYSKLFYLILKHEFFYVSISVGKPEMIREQTQLGRNPVSSEISDFTPCAQAQSTYQIP